MNTTTNTTNRWLILVYSVSLLCMVTVGIGNAYSIWNPDLKSQFHYDQSEIELIGTLGNLGSY